MSLLLQLFLNGLVNGALYSLVAIGFGLIFRSTKVFDISIGGFYTIAAYLLYVFYTLAGIPIIFAILLVMLGMAFLESMNERFIFRPFFNKGASSGAILIASLGLYIIIENVIALIFGNDVKVITQGISQSREFLGIVITQMQEIQFVVGLSVIILFYFAMKITKSIKALWAMGDNPELLSVLGLPVSKLRQMTYIMSGLFVGLASILTALDIGMDPHVGLPVLLNGATAVIVGGVDKYEGWILGSFLLAELNSLVIWKFSARWTPLVTFSLLIIILLFRPQGLLGTKLRLEEMFRSEQ